MNVAKLTASFARVKSTPIPYTLLVAYTAPQEVSPSSAQVAVPHPSNASPMRMTETGT